MCALLIVYVHHGEVQSELVKPYYVEYHSPHSQREEVPPLRKSGSERFARPFEEPLVSRHAVCHMCQYGGCIYNI